MPTSTTSEPTVKSDASLRYGRIIGGAFLLEAVLVAVLIPIQPLLPLNTWITVVEIGVLVLGFGVSWLMLRGVRTRRALHGFLLGVVATVIYLGLCAVGPGGIPAAVAIYGPLLFWFGNIGRIVATTAAGMTRS